MNHQSKNNGNHATQRDDAVLDEVLAECVRGVEQGNRNCRSDLLAKYPDWSDDINEFFSNWDQMEKFSADLSSQRRALEAHARPGANVKYFGDYELMEEIGYGGMGVIYKARQLSLDRIVAVKMILNPRHDRERFRAEAEAAASLDHQNIVSIFEIGEFEGHPYFSMQFVDGVNLGEKVHDGQFEPNDAATLTAKVAGAVHYAHQRGVLHRDLKPANVLLDNSDEPHVTDFGLAKQIQQEEGLTETGTILGTPAYMAPEQAAGGAQQHTTATDVYGVGAILYSLLTGQAPFSGQSSVEIIKRVTDDPPQSPRKIRPTIHRDLETVCLKCLEKDPKARYRSAEHVAEDLERFLRNEPIEARVVGPLERSWRWCRRNPVIATLSGSTALLVVAVAVVSMLLANNERAARLSAQQGQQREILLRKEVGKSLEKETIARREAVGNLVDSFATRGLAAGNRFKSGEAMFWFANAADLAAKHPQRRQANTTSFNSWLQSNPVPVGALWIEDTKIIDVKFQPDGDLLLVSTESDHFLWNPKTSQQLSVGEMLPAIRVTAWHPDGSVIAIGDRQGNVCMLDVASRSVGQQLSFGRSIDSLAFDQSGEQLAIAAGKTVFLWDGTSPKVSEFAAKHPGRIEYITFNRAGNQFITLCRDQKARLFATNDSTRAVGVSNCVVETTSEFRQAFRPDFVNDDQCWMVKPGANGVRLLDTESNQTIREFGIGFSWAFVAAANGKTFANGGETYARLRDLDGKRFSGRLDHGQRVTAMDFNPRNEKIIATSGWDPQVRLWFISEAESGLSNFNNSKLPIATIPHATRLDRLKFSQDGRQLMTQQIDGLIRVWNVPEISEHGYSVPLPGIGCYAQILDEELWLETGMSKISSSVAQLHVRRLDTGEPVGSAIDSGGVVLDAKYSPAGNQVAAVVAPKHRSEATMFKTDGTAGVLRLWNWPDLSPACDDIPMPSEPRSVCYHPSGSHLAVHCAAGEVLWIDATSGIVQQTLLTKREPLEADYNNNNGIVCIDPTGRYLVAGRRHQGLWIWDIDRLGGDDSQIAHIDLHTQHVDFTSDGSLMAMACGRDAMVQVVHTHSGQPACEPIIHPTLVFTARFDVTEERLVTTCRDGQTRVFDWRSGEPHLRGLNHDKDAVDATFTPDGRFLITIGLENLIRVWDADTGRLALKPLQVSDRPTQILVSPDSRYAIISGQVSRIEVLDLEQLIPAAESFAKENLILAELLSNKTLHDGGTIQLSTAEWMERWEEYRAMIGK